jgi:4,5-DOPA dioxygenase extradiol
MEIDKTRGDAYFNPEFPVIFAAHGAPILLDDEEWTRALRSWAEALPRPKAVLMVSAHWERRPLTLGATQTKPLIRDFYGFPQKYYDFLYPAPGAPALASRVRALLEAGGLKCAEAPERGLDHGAYVPLAAMYPLADVPVLQLSMPGLVPGELVALGRALAPLREEGVLIFGSGFLTHNMSYAFKQGIPAWAREFDGWLAEKIGKFDLDALENFRDLAPGAALALPTWEHYAPLLVAAGAAGTAPKVAFPISGWWMDSAFTKRSVQFGG